MDKIRLFVINHWLETALGAILALTPVLRFSWDLWAQSTLHCATIIIVAVFLMLYRPIKSNFSAAMAGFLFAAILTLFVSSNCAATRNELMALVDAMAIAWLFAQLSCDKKRALIVIPCLVGVWFSSILLFYFIKNPIAYFSVGNLQVEPLVNLNIVAGYLLLALGASLLFAGSQNKSAYILPSAIMAGIILTQSRGALILGVAQLIIYSVYNRVITKKALVAAIFITVVLLFIFTLNKIRINDGFYFFATDRLMWWKTALKIFASNPLLGCGWGNFSGVSSIYKPAAGLNSLFCHNLPLQIAAESGLLGFSAACIFVLIVARRAVHILPLALGIFAFLAQNLFDFSFYIPGAKLLFFVMCAYPFDEQPLRRNAGFGAVALIMAVCAGMAVYSVQPLRASRYYQHAVYLLGQGEQKEADSALVIAERIDPIDSQIYAKRAEIAFAYYSSNKDSASIEKAVAFQREAIKHFSTDASLWSDLAWLMAVEGDKEGALSAISNAIKLDRHNERLKGVQRAIISAPPGKIYDK